MTRFTEKTVRSNDQWVKITRDNQARKFTFARGYNHNYSATEIFSYSFKWCANWSDAVDFAQRSIKSYS